MWTWLRSRHGPEGKDSDHRLCTEDVGVEMVLQSTKLPPRYQGQVKLPVGLSYKQLQGLKTGDNIQEKGSWHKKSKPVQGVKILEEHAKGKRSVSATVVSLLWRWGDGGKNQTATTCQQIRKKWFIELIAKNGRKRETKLKGRGRFPIPIKMAVKWRNRDSTLLMIAALLTSLRGEGGMDETGGSPKLERQVHSGNRFYTGQLDHHERLFGRRLTT